MLTKDDISLFCGVIEDVSEDILQRYGAKQEELYEKVEKEMNEIHQAIQLIHLVLIVPSSSKNP
jgi:hypothetical protein